jgi:hypothetical protein
VEAINVDEEEQVLDIRCNNLVIDEVIAWHIANPLRLYSLAVNKLNICFDEFTSGAPRIVHSLFNSVRNTFGWTPWQRKRSWVFVWSTWKHVYDVVGTGHELHRNRPPSLHSIATTSVTGDCRF